METEYKSGEEIFELILSALNNPSKRLEILNGEDGIKCCMCRQMVLKKVEKRYKDYPTCSISCFNKMIRNLKRKNILIPKPAKKVYTKITEKKDLVCSICKKPYTVRVRIGVERLNVCSDNCKYWIKK